MKSAVSFLRQNCTVLALSPIYETIPVGLLNQPNFLNAAVLIETDLTFSAFKYTICRQLEQKLKRVRVADKNAPRTIDCDIVLFNDEIFKCDGNSIPDPEIYKFPHLAVPIGRLLPTQKHPQTGESFTQIAETILKKATANNNGTPPIWERQEWNEALS